MPVKSPDTPELYYKKNLCDVVTACGASCILSNRHLFKGQDASAVNSLTKLMDSTAVDWFCVSPDYLLGEGEAKDAGASQSEEGENDAEKSAAQLQKLDKAKPEDVAFLQFATTGMYIAMLVHRGGKKVSESTEVAKFFY